MVETFATLLDAYGKASGLKIGVRDDKAWPALVDALANSSEMRQQARDMLSICTPAVMQRDWISQWRKATLEGALPKGIK